MIVVGHWAIPGEPVGKGRPKFSTRGGFPRAYTPAKTAQWEGEAVTQIAQMWKEKPLEGPVSVGITAVFSRPKRLMRKKDPDGRICHTVKPDADNISKICLDCLQKAGVLRDDSIAYQVAVAKYYGAKTEAPRVEISVF